jgi:hypothetical protein
MVTFFIVITLYNTKSEENAFTGKDVIRYEKKQTDVAIIWGLTI